MKENLMVWMIEKKGDAIWSVFLKQASSVEYAKENQKKPGFS